MKNKYAFILFIFALSKQITAQDSQYSMIDASPVMLNPALTGTEKDNPFRSVIQYRNQWSSVSSSYVTSSFAIDLPLNKWGFGGFITNNETARLINELTFVISGSYDVLDPKGDHHLSAGANIGFINKKLDQNKLVFDSQFDDKVFNENLESGENLIRNSRFLPEVSFGINYKYTEYKQVFNPYLGAAIFHMTRPDESFISTIDSKLPMRFVINGGANLNFDNHRIIINPKATFITQGKATNLLLGITGDFVINDEVKTNIGASYRFKDALIPQVGITYLNFTYLIAYDINISGLSEFSNNRGALEFALLYNIGSKKKSYFRFNNKLQYKK